MLEIAAWKGSGKGSPQVPNFVQAILAKYNAMEKSLKELQSHKKDPPGPT